MSELIRLLEGKDTPQIHRIERLCFSDPWSEESISHDLEENVLSRWLGIFDDSGRLIAYGGIWLVINEGHILNIAVDPEFQGNGYGKRIMNALIELARENGINILFLEVRRSNLRAQKLYLGAGFMKAGYRKQYYEDNREDALIMIMNLDPPENEDE